MGLKKWIAIGVVGVMALGIVGCASYKNDNNSVGTITISGSSALLPLAKLAGKHFKTHYPDVSLTVNGGGSGTGLKQVFDGSVTIGNSDVAAEDKLAKEQAAQLVDHKVAVVTMATVGNKKVVDVVKSLTKEQLKGIFTGTIKNWKEVGGPDVPVTLISRPTTSGTKVLFEKYALDGTKEARNKSLETDDSGALIQIIADNEGAIGYVAMSYLGRNPKVVPLAVEGVLPSLENTYNGSYPVWGYEHMYTKGEPTGVVKAYLDYVVSDEFGKELEALGYGVTSKMKVAR